MDKNMKNEMETGFGACRLRTSVVPLFILWSPHEKLNIRKKGALVY